MRNQKICDYEQPLTDTLSHCTRKRDLGYCEYQRIYPTIKVCLKRMRLEESSRLFEYDSKKVRGRVNGSNI